MSGFILKTGADGKVRYRARAGKDWVEGRTSAETARWHINEYGAEKADDCEGDFVIRTGNGWYLEGEWTEEPAPKKRGRAKK